MDTSDRREIKILPLAPHGRGKFALMVVHGTLESFLAWSKNPIIPCTDPQREIARRREEMIQAVQGLLTLDMAGLDESRASLVRMAQYALSEFNASIAPESEWVALLNAITSIEHDYAVITASQNARSAA